MDPKKDGINWYVYCSNNPLKFVDPDGLSGILVIYSKKSDDNKWGHSWIAFTDDATGETTTYGTWPTGDDEGLLYENMEKVYIKDNDDYVGRETDISDEQQETLEKVISEYEDKGNKAWTLYNPCSAFAADAWNRTTGEKLEDRNFWTISNPKTLYESINNVNKQDMGNNETPNIEQSNDSDPYYNSANRCPYPI